MRIEYIKMSEDELVRPHFLFNSTGQLVRVKQWLPQIRRSPAISRTQNSEKNKNISNEQSKVSPNKRIQESTTTSSGSISAQVLSSELDIMATKKDNLHRVAAHQKSRVSLFIKYWGNP